MKKDWDTQEQCDLFDEFLDDTSDSRTRTWTQAYGYDELEWEAFQYGWNAAKKHFGIGERAIPMISAEERALLAGIESSESFTIEGAKKAFGVDDV